MSCLSCKFYGLYCGHFSAEERLHLRARSQLVPANFSEAAELFWRTAARALLELYRGRIQCELREPFRFWDRELSLHLPLALRYMLHFLASLAPVSLAGLRANTDTEPPCNVRVLHCNRRIWLESNKLSLDSAFPRSCSPFSDRCPRQ